MSQKGTPAQESLTMAPLGDQSGGGWPKNQLDELIALQCVKVIPPGPFPFQSTSRLFGDRMLAQNNVGSA
jgi:hypothetical protein